jgi:glutaredoxin
MKNKTLAVAVPLIMYGRSGCHLCDDMREALESCRDELDFSLEFRDIDARSDWQRRYGERIPVLFSGESEICHYYLDRQALLEHFRHAR